MLGGTDPKNMARYLALSQVGFEMVGPIVLGLVLDYYLDWSPWCVLVGAVLGLVGGIAHLVQLSRTTGQKKPPESA
jgi:F0F1-type ATP synthase assembly protein I